MKKIMRCIAFLLTIIMLLTGNSFASYAALPVSGLTDKTIVAFGDSLTQFTSSNGYSYVDYLSENAGVDIINSGIGGNTTDHAMARFQTDVLDYNPDLVIICFGMNDQATVEATGEPLIALDTYIQNLSYFAETLQAMGSDVLFVTPNPVYEEKYTPNDYGLDYTGDYLPVFCNAMKEVAIKYGCDVVDINLEFTKEYTLAQLVEDGIHQSDLGRQVWAYHIGNYLDAVYDNENKATMTVNCVDENGVTLDSYTINGYAGANITLASPDIIGYSVSDDITTTFVDGATHTFTYSLNLQDSIDEAKEIRASDYDEDIIAEIIEVVAEAEALLVDENTSYSELVACSEKLKSLIALSGKNEKIVSSDASYVVSDANRENYLDDGKKLTDGIKGITSGNTETVYDGWTTSKVTIDFDLGSEQTFDLARIYAASYADWGIEAPVELTISIPDGNGGYTEVASSFGKKTEYSSADWWTYTLTAYVNEPITVQNVRLTVTSDCGFVWLDEAELALSVEPSDNVLYISKINEMITPGDAILYTPDFGEITVDNANHAWTTNIIAKEYSDGAYTVTSVTSGVGATTPSVTLGESEVLIAVHEWEETVSESVANKELANMLSEGMTIEIKNVDVENASLGIAPYVKASDITTDMDILAGDTFWVTHFNDNAAEGAGVIFTQEYTGCAWCVNVAFSPVEGKENVYKITDMNDGTSDGSGIALSIPDGGFVYTINSGNNYPQLYINTGDSQYDGKPNYTSTACSAALTAIKGWNIGDQFVISGVDTFKQEVPTDTPYTDWFDTAYVCNATIKAYEENESTDTTVDEAILYQRKDNDIRLVAYVDALENYASVAFTLKIGDNVSKPLACTTAYNGLYANGISYTTEQIYGVEGYFVTYTINRYLEVYAGQEVTITVTYTSVTGEISTDERTVTIGTKEDTDEPVVIETGSFDYVNGYDWTNTSSQIYVFASSDSTVTPASLHGQGVGFMGWFTGIVYEYNATKGTWVVTEVCLPDGTNEAEATSLGDNKMVVIFHSNASVQGEDYNFFVNHSVVGEELYLSGSLSTIQSTTGEITDVFFTTSIVEE